MPHILIAIKKPRADVDRRHQYVHHWRRQLGHGEGRDTALAVRPRHAGEPFSRLTIEKQGICQREENPSAFVLLKNR